MQTINTCAVRFSNCCELPKMCRHRLSRDVYIINQIIKSKIKQVSLKFRMCAGSQSHQMLFIRINWIEPWLTLFGVTLEALSDWSTDSGDQRVSSRNVASLQSTSSRRYFRGSLVSFRSSFFWLDVAVHLYSRHAHSRTTSSRLMTFLAMVWSIQLQLICCCWYCSQQNIYCNCNKLCCTQSFSCHSRKWLNIRVTWDICDNLFIISTFQ